MCKIYVSSVDIKKIHSRYKKVDLVASFSVFGESADCCFPSIPLLKRLQLIGLLN